MSTLEVDELKHEIGVLRAEVKNLQRDLEAEQEHSAGLAEENLHYEHLHRSLESWGPLISAAAELAICVRLHPTRPCCSAYEDWLEATSKIPYDHLLTAATGDWEGR